jgi:hypothetical protein
LPELAEFEVELVLDNVSGSGQKRACVYFKEWVGGEREGEQG